MKKLAVVILNYNGADYLKKFIPVLIKHNLDNISDLWIIDNCSTDNSVNIIKDKFSSVNLICLDKNYGFTGGYNKGLKEIKAEYFLILNSDIEVSENWINPLVNYMDNNPDTGICGPKLLDYNDKSKFEYAGAAGGYIDKLGYPFCKGRIFDYIEDDKSQYDQTENCFWVSGAALMIRSELFNLLNGFDDDFFAHMEEIDLCWRTQSIGYKVTIIPESKVYHVGGGTLSKLNYRKTYFNFRNNLSLLFKNMTTKKLIFVLLIRLVLDQVAVLKMILDGSFSHALAVYRAYFSFLVKIPSLLKKRKGIKQISESKLIGFYKKSIVFQHFLFKKKSFSDL